MCPTPDCGRYLQRDHVAETGKGDDFDAPSRPPNRAEFHHGIHTEDGSVGPDIGTTDEAPVPQIADKAGRRQQGLRRNRQNGCTRRVIATPGQIILPQGYRKHCKRTLRPVSRMGKP